MASLAADWLALGAVAFQPCRSQSPTRRHPHRLLTPKDDSHDRHPEELSPADMQGAVAAFQRHASAALLAGGTPRVANIAEAASRETLGVAHAVAWLEEHGQLECDGELLAGAHGLTRRTTIAHPHHRRATLHT
jgi:hypothetical protein